jgi:hypothetical protein
MPCRAGIGYIPTNDWNFGSSRRAFHDFPADRVGAIEHHERNLLLRGRLHRQRHRRHVRPRAAADLLQIVDEQIDILQHLGRRSAVFGLVEREDRHAGLRIALIIHLFTRRDVAAHPVFRREQHDQ